MAKLLVDTISYLIEVIFFYNFEAIGKSTDFRRNNFTYFRRHKKINYINFAIIRGNKVRNLCYLMKNNKFDNTNKL